MIVVTDIVRQLASSGEAMRALVHNIPEEQALWQPAPDVWSMRRVMEHVYNEERQDFRTHLKEILNKPSMRWGEIEVPYQAKPDIQQCLMDFLAEREASIAWLRGLASPDWDVSIEADFGPEGNKEHYTFSGGDVLASWVAHDYLHLRQMNELHFAWNKQAAEPYTVFYAGQW